MPNLQFEGALPRLIAAYNRGLLVPFIGAGMSSGACPSWPEFVQALEREAKATNSGQNSSSSDLIRRADQAVLSLRRSGVDQVTRAVRRCLGNGSATVPAQTKALARIWWPLVATTNYDEIFATEFTSASDGGDAGKRQLEVLGRSEQDVQRVLSSLSVTDVPILWALQGFLPRKAETFPEVGHLADEVVVGHEEYRRVTHRQPHFRRAFAEVYRRRSFLFLGSGLAETYFLDLFGEVLEFFGPNPNPHYACIQKDENVDAEFLRRRFNIHVLPYNGHDQLPAMIARLRKGIAVSRARSTRWGFRIASATELESQAERDIHAQDDLTVVRGSLPPELKEGSEGWVLSAGLSDGGPYVGKWVRKMYPDIATQFDGRPFKGIRGSRGAQLFPPANDVSGHLARVAAVSAWADDNRRDLGLIGEAVGLAMGWAVEHGLVHVRMPLLASGVDHHFGSRFSLSAMVRGYASWRRNQGPCADEQPTLPRLTIHVVNPEPIFELTTGRMDIDALLNCEEYHVWIEIVNPDGRLERELAIVTDDTAIGDLAVSHGVLGEHWHVQMEPRPKPEVDIMEVQAEPPQRLGDVGTMPGGTIRFSQRSNRKNQRKAISRTSRVAST